VSEHGFEPVRGLPGLLPPGEKVLWQGGPDWVSLARGPFFGDWVAVYFAALVAWRFWDGIDHGVGAWTAASVATTLIPVAAAALGVIALVAWATARSTVYTITTRRVVLRIGVAFTVSVNAPFRKVAAASVRVRDGDRGDIALEIGGGDRFKYLMLWPHARPWRFENPQPMLRAVPEAARVAAILGEALAAFQAEHGMALDPARPPAPAAPEGAAAASPRPGMVAAE
jgi:hypothetical protein